MFWTVGGRAFDVDVLVRCDARASPFHDKAKTLVELTRRAEVSIGPSRWSYHRVVTHPTLLGAPLAPEVAVENIRALPRPHVRQVSEANGFWPVYRRVADGQAARQSGSRRPPVALMRHTQHATIWSHDRDFRKFGH